MERDGRLTNVELANRIGLMQVLV
ncbi:hypothetical protein [Streptomyces atratus]|nr:hypothetical protein [Streptomyces atratus]